MTRLRIPFRHVHRVRYRETDQQGVVYHTHYLDHFEAARTELLRAAGLPYRTLEEQGILFVVTEMGCRILKGAAYDQELMIDTSISEIAKASLHFDYVTHGSDGTIFVTGYTVLACLDSKTRRIRRLPQEVVELKRLVRGDLRPL